MLHPSVVERLERLAPDQRAAATAPPGPVLCVAPAGSGKTTTLVARVAWLVASAAATPDAICAVTFNKRAAEELAARLDAALQPLGLESGAVRVRTFHALGREILRDAGAAVEPLMDRGDVLRRIVPDASPAERRRLDDAFSRLKLDLGVQASDIAGDPAPGPTARVFLAYEIALQAGGGLDFDDLVARALRALEQDRPLLTRWRERCAHLLVDETQDVDRSQLRLALLLAAPSNRIFLVGDDDQTIYGWRLADVRRILGLAASLPGLRRVDLETNYRCPRPVVERAVRLVALNRERFEKVVRPGPAATGSLVLAPDASDDAARARHVLESWPDDDSTRAILARTNRELLPAAAVCLERAVAFRAARVPLLLEDQRLDALLDEAAATPETWPLLRRLGAVRTAIDRVPLLDADTPEHRDTRHGQDGEADTLDPAPDDAPSLDDLVAAMLGWAAPYRDLQAFRATLDERRRTLRELCREDARLTLATAHATKGLEFDHVAVVDLDDARFPSARSLADAADPERTLEEERRLAYVAWTRARSTLTLVYDPAAPSPFLMEAFAPHELGLQPG